MGMSDLHGPAGDAESVATLSMRRQGRKLVADRVENA
jgi:hypothetical protein